MSGRDLRLLAKSPRADCFVDLAAHSRDVAHAAVCLFGRVDGPPTRLGEAWLRFFRVDREDSYLFFRTLAAAAWLHDVGKADSGFQAAVRKLDEQVVRHEHLSALLMCQHPWLDWLRAVAQVDANAAIAAVLCHHLKSRQGEIAVPAHGDPFVLTLPLDASEVNRIRLELAATLAVAPPAVLPPLTWNRSQLSAMAGQQAFGRRAYEYRREIQRNPETRAFCAAVKSALIVADAAGSAVTRLGVSVQDWLARCFCGPLLTPEWLDEHIIFPRRNEVEQKTGKPFVWHDFQKAAGELGPRALLLVACGTGKTLAAWRWAREQLRVRPSARVIFLYPTRATATEGFRDYVSWAGGDHAALIHGTAEYDLAALFENPDDPRHRERYTSDARLFALAQWDRRVFSATVDQFFSFLDCQYGSMCLLPLLADSVLVIDEVHAFNARMLWDPLESTCRHASLSIL